MQDRELVLNKGDIIGPFRVMSFLKYYNGGEVECYDVELSVGGGERFLLKLTRDRKRGMPAEFKECRLFMDEDLGSFPAVFLAGDYFANGVGYKYFTRTYARGKSVAEYMQEGKTYTWREAKLIIFQVLMALKYLHNHKKTILHNYICPSSVLIDNTVYEEVILLGTSRFTYEGGPEPDGFYKTLDLAHTAPETVKGVYDKRTDLFSVGALMFTMLYGKDIRKMLITPGTFIEDPDAAYFCRQIAESATLPIITLTDDHKEFLCKLLDIDPDKRFQSAEDALDALVRLPEEGESVKKMKKESDRKPENQKPAGKSGSAEGNFGKALSGKKKVTSVKSTKKEGASRNGGKRGLDDVAGMEDVKEILRKRVLFVLENPECAKEYKLHMPNSMMLYGPPGCGKTYLAECFSKEADMNFVSAKASDLGSHYIHDTQKNIAKLFAEAEKKAPSVLFLDEFDAMVPDRRAMNSEHYANEVNEFLVQLNKCGERGIFVITATNCPDKIDPAVLRTSRTDYMFYVPMPDFEARKEIFRLALNGRKVSDDIDYDALAQLSEGYVASDINFIVNECAFDCAYLKVAVGMKDLVDKMKVTRYSVSKKQVEEFENMRKKFEKNTSDIRKKIGFKAS